MPEATGSIDEAEVARFRRDGRRLVGPGRVPSAPCTSSIRCGSPISRDHLTAHFRRDQGGIHPVYRARAGRYRLRAAGWWAEPHGNASARASPASTPAPPYRRGDNSCRAGPGSPSIIALVTAEALAEAGQRFDIVLSLEYHRACRRP